MIKQKDNKIAKLTAEIATLKGEEVPAAAAPSGPSAGGAAAGGSNLPTRPGVFGARGGAQAATRGGRGGAAAGQGTVRPIVPAKIPTGPAGAAAQPTTVASIRGAATAGEGVQESLPPLRGWTRWGCSRCSSRARARADCGGEAKTLSSGVESSCCWRSGG